jgi:hypothetical protein
MPSVAPSCPPLGDGAHHDRAVLSRQKKIKIFLQVIHHNPNRGMPQRPGHARMFPRASDFLRITPTQPIHSACRFSVQSSSFHLLLPESFIGVASCGQKRSFPVVSHPHTGQRLISLPREERKESRGTQTGREKRTGNRLS